MMAACILPLTPSFSSLRINPSVPSSSPHSCCKCFSSPFRCKSSHRNWGVSVADRVLMDIQNSGIIACLRAQSAEVAIEAARAALSGGVSVLEITMSTPGVFEALKCLVQEYPSASIGVGTVLDRRSAKDALKLGAKFLMSPAMVKSSEEPFMTVAGLLLIFGSKGIFIKYFLVHWGILDDVAGDQALYIPGAMTPTEILSAFDAGARIIKVYPVAALGGVEYIAAIKKPFPHIPMVASQGITLDSLGQYIAKGTSSVVLSDAIFDKKAMARHDFVLINKLASFAANKGNEAVRFANFH